MLFINRKLIIFIFLLWGAGYNTSFATDYKLQIRNTLGYPLSSTRDFSIIDHHCMLSLAPFQAPKGMLYNKDYTLKTNRRLFSGCMTETAFLSVRFSNGQHLNFTSPWNTKVTQLILSNPEHEKNKNKDYCLEAVGKFSLKIVKRMGSICNKNSVGIVNP